MKLLIIGAGRMSEAIISGLVQQGRIKAKDIIVSNQKSMDRLQALQQTYHVTVTPEWPSYVHQVDAVLLAAPPHAHDTLLAELSHSVSQPFIMTVAAGIDPTYMEERLPQGTPVAWIMPNTAAQVQRSLSTYTLGRYVTEKDKQTLHMILEAIGQAVLLSEQQVHDMTAITGSAPAFLYLFCEALEKAAQSYGVSPEQARTLVTNMISGSAAMLEAGYDPGDLREQVTTPGGSTAAGLDILHQHRFEALLKEAVKATNAHARGEQ
ncbi:pyrroline-5-carboxylate reductase [Caldalkalibacillus salinus]|uniref:pyrroline-5-carboxylate reductase n=1 Tax=Caldalkalibacillus salinus TaxID=2803787 RepID=UPI00192111EB|nr:pyrroline-5-carboxylate reductase [Caldalkalibacillus salinus]